MSADKLSNGGQGRTYPHVQVQSSAIHLTRAAWGRAALHEQLLPASATPRDVPSLALPRPIPGSAAPFSITSLKQAWPCRLHSAIALHTRCLSIRVVFELWASQKHVRHLLRQIDCFQVGRVLVLVLEDGGGEATSSLGHRHVAGSGGMPEPGACLAWVNNSSVHMVTMIMVCQYGSLGAASV
jgi:hypothetical protein